MRDTHSAQTSAANPSYTRAVPRTPDQLCSGNLPGAVPMMWPFQFREGSNWQEKFSAVFGLRSGAKGKERCRFGRMRAPAAEKRREGMKRERDRISVAKHHNENGIIQKNGRFLAAWHDCLRLKRTRQEENEGRRRKFTDKSGAVSSALT